MPQRSDSDLPQRSSSGTPPMDIKMPSSPDVLEPERLRDGERERERERDAEATQSVALERPVDPDKYVCGRGDVFELNFWGRQNFRLRALVDMEGRTFIPKIGYVNIVGRTLTDARNTIKKAVFRYYPGLNFDLSLFSPRKFQVHVVGFVKRPGVYVSNPLERVAALVSRAGDATGSRRRINITRRDGTKATADLVLYEQTGDIALNPYLQDGDVVEVPAPALSVTISGAVRRPGSYELTGNKDLGEAVSLAGGFAPTFTTELPVRIRRRNKEELNQQIVVKVAEAATVPPAALKNDDAIFIPSAAELQRSIMLIGPLPGAQAADEVTQARRFSYSIGSTVRTILDEAGGVGASADLKGAYIRKIDGTVTEVDLEALLMKRDFSADKPVQIGDTIVIPQKRRGIAVQGAVGKPDIYPYNPQFSGAQYVGVAGGPKSNAQSSSGFQVISAEGKYRSFSEKGVLQPGDTVIVPERTFTRGEIVQLVMGSVALVVSTFSLVYLVSH